MAPNLQHPPVLDHESNDPLLHADNMVAPLTPPMKPKETVAPGTAKLSMLGNHLMDGFYGDPLLEFHPLVAGSKEQPREMTKQQQDQYEIDYAAY